MRSVIRTCKLINMNLTDEQRALIINALKNDASTMNNASHHVTGSARTLMAGEANNRVALAAALDRSLTFGYNVAAPDQEPATEDALTSGSKSVILTVNELLDRLLPLRELHSNAPIFVYCGPEGVRVQVESPDFSTPTHPAPTKSIITAPSVVPAAGGPAI